MIVLKYFGLTMPGVHSIIYENILCWPWHYSSNYLSSYFANKIVLPNVSIVICWMFPALWYVICMCQNHIELMLFLLQFILLIAWLPQFWTKSSFSLFYPDKPLFSLTPHVFCCVSFVHLLGLGKNKLPLRSVKCVFFGYSRTQKGYRWYNPVSHRYYVSVDVTFFESSIFFSMSAIHFLQI